jgi:integrase
MAKKKRPTLIHCKVTQTANPRAPWRVWFTVERNGKPTRAFQSFATEEAAWQAAEDKDREISNHGIRYGDIPPEIRRAFDFYRDERAAMEAAGMEVPRIEELIADSLAAIRRRHDEQAERALLVGDALPVFLAYKKTRVKERQLADLQTRLARFKADFCNRTLRSITTPEVEAWLASLQSRRNPGNLAAPPPVSPLTRNHYRATLHAFFKFGCAPARGWLDRNPVAEIEKEQEAETEPTAYSPKAAQAIMQAAVDHKPELVPVLALGMFCGLRVSEAAAMELATLPRVPGEFRTTGKTGPRLAPMTEAAVAFLAAQPRRDGKAWLKSIRQLVDDMRTLFPLAGVAPIGNGARHSFITFRTAEIRDVGRVADECGTSPGVIRNHYRELVSAEAAAAYFAIRPEAPAANVVPMQGRASA